MEKFEEFKNLCDMSKKYYELWKKSYTYIKLFIENLSFDEICEFIIMIMKTNNFTDFSNKEEFISFLISNRQCYLLITYGNIPDYDNVYNYINRKKYIKM